MKVATKRVLKNVLYVTLAAGMVTACGGKQSPRAAGVTTVDKKMSCQDLQLEINDAEYIRQTAMQNKGLSARNILWPFGYPSTYMSAEEALESAERRLNYLQRVYVIKDCERPLS